jgi:glycosyltransferase involved in cell wall biosynthesis
MDWPQITIVICTYDRADEFKRVLVSLRDNLRYDNLKWHIADDGTGDDYIPRLMAFMEDYGVNSYDIASTITDRQGWGANVNRALQSVDTEYVYFTEDDYALLRPLDLRTYVAMMEEDADIGMVRFGIVGHDGMICTIREADISQYMHYNEIEGTGCSGSGKVGYLDIELTKYKQYGPFGFYRYSNRPHLKRMSFHQKYGLYPEGLPLAKTEDAFNHHIAAVARMSSGGEGSKIVCPLEWSGWYYDHIGKSRQGSELDVTG